MKKVLLLLTLFVITTSIVSAEAPVVFEKYWEKLCGMPIAADDVRSVSIYPGGDLFATVDRNAKADAIKLFNLQSGQPNIKVETLAMSGTVNSIPSGLYNIIEGDFTSDGKFIACNLAYTGSFTLKVYIWDTLTTGPRMIYQGNQPARSGDALDVIGSTADNSAKVLISGNNAASRPIRLTTADNGRTWSATILPTAVRAQEIEQIAGTDEFYASYTGGNIQRYDANGAIPGGYTVPPYRITAAAGHANASFALDFAADRIYIMGHWKQATIANKLRVVKLSTGVELAQFAADPLDIGKGDIGTEFANGSASCELMTTPGGGKFVYAMSERNGIARYSYSTQVAVPADYATIQGAIDAFNVGQTLDPAITTTVTLPLRIAIDPNDGPYDTIMNLNPLIGTGGNIAGDLLLISSIPGTLAQIKLRTSPGSPDDGLQVHQDINGVIMKDLLFCPSTTTPVTDDLLKFDENAANSAMNWIEFWNVVVTDIIVGGNPMVTDKTQALVGPHPVRGSSMASSDQLIKLWNDSGESINCLADNLVVYGGASYACGLIMNGIDGEQVYVNDSLFAWNDYAGLEIGFRAGVKTKYARVTGTDAGAGPLSCTASIQNQWHGLYLYANVDGVCKVDNYLCYVDILGDTTGNDARGISGSGYVDLSIRDSIIMARNACIVDGVTNYPEFPAVWERTTFINNSDNANNTLYALSNSSILNVKDCVIGGPGTKFSGTTAANVLLNNCNIIRDGTWAIGALGNATEVANIYRYDPVFANTNNPLLNTLFDVRSPLAAGKSSTGGNLVGGADFIGDATPAVCSVTPASHDFGEKGVGSGAFDFTFEVKNTGVEPLYIYSTTVNGSSDFSVQKAAASPLVANTSDTMIIRYTPTTTGAQAANIEIAASIAGSPKLVPVTGFGATFQIVSNADVFTSPCVYLTECPSNADLIEGVAGIVEAGGFHGAYSGGVNPITNGDFDTDGVTALAADYGLTSPSLVLRYDNLHNATINKVIIFSGHNDPSSGARAFINCKVEVLQGGIWNTLTILTTGAFGTPAPMQRTVAFTKMEGTAIATAVDGIKFSFYCVANSFATPYEFEAPGADAIEGTIIKEIDVFGENYTSVSDWRLIK